MRAWPDIRCPVAVHLPRESERERERESTAREVALFWGRVPVLSEAWRRGVPRVAYVCEIYTLTQTEYTHTTHTNNLPRSAYPGAGLHRVPPETARSD